MSLFRYSLAGLLAATAFCAINLAAWRSPSQLSAGASLTLTTGVLLYGTLAAILQREPSRNFWIGFALFGWLYLMMLRLEPYGSNPYWINLPTTQLLSRFMRYGWVTDNSSDAIDVFRQGQVLHFMFTLVFALLGGMLAAWVSSRTNRPPKHSAA